MANSDQRPVLHVLADCLAQGFHGATLTSPSGLGSQKTFRVTGGLRPGLRSTSCVGSGWNAIFGLLAKRLTRELQGAQDGHGLALDNSRGFSQDDLFKETGRLANVPPPHDPDARSFHDRLLS